MTPIQAQSLPLILEGRDLIAQAKTGSGKTAASAWACCRRSTLLAGAAMPGAVPHAGTGRPGGAGTAPAGAPDLQHQGADPVRRRGGAPQAESLAHGAHVVVGTPGRIQDHLARGSLDLAGLNTLVLDEADRMVDMGFYDDIVAIASHCPTKRQTPCSRPPTPTTSASWPPVSCAIRPRSRSRPSTTPAASSRSSTRSSPRNAWTPSPACWRISGQRPRWPSATPRSAATTWSRP